MKVLLFLIFSTISISQACEINMFDNYLFTSADKQPGLQQSFKSSSCEPEVQKKLLLLLGEVQGVIDTKILQQMLKIEYIRLTPSKIKVSTLQGFLLQNEILNERARWVTQAEATNSYLIGYDNEDELQINCAECSTTGSKRLRVDKISPAGVIRSLWFIGTIQAGVEVYIANKDLPAHQQMDPEKDLSKKILFSKNPQEFYLENKNLKFYRLSRTLQRGTPLKSNQVIPVNLVRAGDLVNLKLKHNNLMIATKATAISSGKIDEMVKIRNQKSGRIIQGKVIDYNRVEVEL